ncbi:MAG: hypothetical protein HY785_18745 [Oscillatoriophycideae cyanobacterium NC_groundwater_1537_Pr4_S-0.65um_50_18]|nr:hypothetical protein [Oscillatoriophycideae cyanobacterium NC_groundwater_1537_Pr4_S-0.65um_50_18]
MQPPDIHFQELEEVFQRHAAALESEVRALQQAHETAQWPSAWKQIYNWKFARCFSRQKIWRNWAADAAAWGLLPDRQYPNRGNQMGCEQSQE